MMMMMDLHDCLELRVLGFRVVDVSWTTLTT